MRNLAAFPDLVARYRLHEEPTEPGCLVEVLAPCCGRRTMADTILDVRDVPGTIVAGGGHQEPRDHDWLCYDCRFRLYANRANAWTRSRLYSALGAPAAQVRELHAQEAAEHAESWLLAGGHSFDVVELRAIIAASLPEGIDPHRTSK